ncbi:unnamed protein product [Allacma fusca]|uniref:Uncharacterized protein n=1 Tax=Allacma fusca TaxID=39272 RepID=A0A8J2JA38_9HEXA|nr:unnamed protein product [Allacma fusca]
MNIEQALREEVEALLANQPASINTKPTSPLSKRIRSDDNPSVFHSTWQIITNPFDTRTGVPGSTLASKNQDDFSDFSAALSGLSSHVFKCQLLEDESSLHSFELSETGLLSQANSQSVGPPSLQDSEADLYSGNSCTGDIAGTERSNKVRKRRSSRILDHSKLGPNQISTGEVSRKSSSNGLNKILESNTSVGSTHRASNNLLGPRCANDYMQRVRKSESEKKQEEIPTRIYEYPDITSNISEKEGQPYSDTPVIKEGPLFSPINKTFLDCVNEQIQHIKYEQAKERLLFCSTNSEDMGDVAKKQSDSSQDARWEENVSRSKTTSIGTNPIVEEPKPSTQIPSGTKVDLCIQTDSSQITSLNSPNPWGPTSKADSQISLMSLKAKRLGCHRSDLKQSFYPLSPDTVSDECISSSRRLPRTRLPRSSSFFGNFLNFNNAMGITRYSLQAAWNTAEEIFYGYIVPPEIENEPPIEDNYEENEGRMAVSIMKLMGISVDTRHAIYREVLGEIHALNDFSVGTVQAISSVIDWICTGKHGGTEDLIAKTRLLCTSQTEVDPDSESWKGFERDMYIFTNAVVKTVGHAAKAVSRQYSNGSNDSLVPASVSSPASQCYIGQNTDPNENPHGLSIKFDIPESREDPSSAVSTPEEVDFDPDAPVNPDLISQLVTDSEFDLPVTPVVPGSGSTTSNVSTGSSSVYRRRSRIPVRVDSTKSHEPKDTDENFNLKVLKSALRHDQKQTYTCEVRNFKQRFASPPAENPLSRQASCSNYSYANAYKTSQLKKGLSPGSSNSSLPSTSKCVFRSGEVGNLRERFLCREDALLLKECRRLTALSNSNDSSNSGTGGSISMNESRNESPPSYIRNLQNEGSASYSTGFDRNILPADISHLASAIASVATSVTSTLLSRASSAASYIPSFTDTFGPQVDAECRFPECSPDGPSSILDTIQQAASNVIFGFDEPLLEENIRPRRSVRSINRFPMSPDLHDHSDSLKPKINASGSNRSQSGSESAMSLNSSHNDAAWELFDYIKRGEAEKIKEKVQMAARTFSEQGIAEQPPPNYLDSPAEPSVTARLSKAALTGLFNALTESHPSILTSAPQSQHSIQEESLIHPRSNPSPTPTQCTLDKDGQKYRTCSGHNYILNSRMSSAQANLRANPSIPLLFAPQNSDTGFNRSNAQLRMEEDVAYLHNVIKEYYNDKLKKNPINIHQTPMTTQQRSRSHQQGSGRSKIPRFGTKTTDNKILSSSNEPSTSTLSNNLPSTISLDTHVTSHISVRNDYTNLNSNLEFCAGPGNKAVTKLRSNTNSNNARPKIVHPSKAPVPSRAAPMKSKPKVHVLDVSQLDKKPPQPTKYTGSNGSSGANSITASRTPSFASSNATGKSYLNILKQKERTVSNRTPGRGIGSYSSTNRQIQQSAHQEGYGIGGRRNENGKNLQRRSSHEHDVDGSGYKYDDGTHKINPGASLCSSSCSTGPVSINASAHQPINHGNKNQKENVSDVDNDTNNVAHIPNGPLFFPSLDNSRLPLPPMLTNPFARFRGSEAGKDTHNQKRATRLMFAKSIWKHPSAHYSFDPDELQ